MNTKKERAYAEFLESQGIAVVEMAGIYWMRHHSALLPVYAMPTYVQFSRKEALLAIKETGTLFIRYISKPSRDKTNWWYMVCRQYNFTKLSSNTRSKIRRGLKRMEIKRVDPIWIAKHGYECHVNSYKRYKFATPQSRSEFQCFYSSIDPLSFFDLWVCIKDKELLGYVLCLIEKNGVFTHTIDLTPTGLQNYAAYAMIHTLLEHYVNKLELSVCNGTRPVAHATEMQDFLRKFDFKREYSELNIIYRPGFDVLIRLFYPFRNLFKHLSIVPAFYKLSSFLAQEEIVRECHTN